MGTSDAVDRRTGVYAFDEFSITQLAILTVSSLSQGKTGHRERAEKVAQAARLGAMNREEAGWVMSAMHMYLNEVVAPVRKTSVSHEAFERNLKVLLPRDPGKHSHVITLELLTMYSQRLDNLERALGLDGESAAQILATYDLTRWYEFRLKPDQLAANYKKRTGKELDSQVAVTAITHFESTAARMVDQTSVVNNLVNVIIRATQELPRINRKRIDKTSDYDFKHAVTAMVGNLMAHTSERLVDDEISEYEISAEQLAVGNLPVDRYLADTVTRRLADQIVYESLSGLGAVAPLIGRTVPPVEQREDAYQFGWGKKYFDAIYQGLKEAAGCAALGTFERWFNAFPQRSLSREQFRRAGFHELLDAVDQSPDLAGQR
jgi:hypothetical protein